MLKAVEHGEMLQFYERFSSYALVHGVKVPSFEEFYGLSSNEGEASAFDPETEKAMEQRALALLEERKKAAHLSHGTTGQ